MGEKQSRKKVLKILSRTDISEVPPQIGEELFYLVGLRRQGEGPAKVENVVVYRCVTARGVWL